MSLVSLEGIARAGIIPDVPPSNLPPNSEVGVFAWSGGINTCFRNNAIIRVEGWKAVFGTPPVVPYFLSHIRGPEASYRWVYAGLDKVYSTDGTTHSDLTRAAGDYTGQEDNKWGLTRFGDIPILNNGVDVPQFWSPINDAQKLQNLSNWDSTHRCDTIQSFAGKLVAGNILKNTTRYTNLIKWSHTANVGTLPSSWDHTATNLDAGEWPLMGDGDAIVELAPLGRRMLIYRENSVDYMFPTGDGFIFGFDNYHTDYGVPSRNCVVAIPKGRHAVFTGADIVLHNGQSSDEILHGKWSDYLEKHINPVTYRRSFLLPSYLKKELHLCFPEGSSTFPNRAITWNWQYNTLHLREIPLSAHGAQGAVAIFTADDSWEGDGATWESDSTTWDAGGFDPVVRRLLFAGVDSKFYFDESAAAQAGLAFNSSIERLAFGVPFNKEHPADITSIKNWLGVYLRVSGPADQVLKVYFGGRETAGGIDTWLDPVDFIIGQDVRVSPPDGVLSARFLSLRIANTSDLPYTIEGIDLEVEYGGDF